MKKKYDKEVKKGKPAKNKKGKENTDQTNWVFLDRETLEGLLAKADQDPKVGGIQFYFTEYTEKTAKKIYPDNPADYTGQMTLVMRPANLKDNKLVTLELGGGEGDYVNGTAQCPYQCEPEPTDT